MTEKEVTTPLVSVIVRTKDRPGLLKEALGSISEQTYRPLEVVLVNDGGCHLDGDVYTAFLGEIPMHYVRHEQARGRSAALNAGAERASGIYLAFLDDDDIYCPDGIASLVEGCVKSGARAVYGQVLCRTLPAQGRQDEMESGVLGEPFSFGKLLFENYIATNALLVSKALEEETGPFDPAFEIFEDWDWIIRMACISEPRFVDAVVGVYRTFTSSTLTGKGGIELHRFYREKLLEKHLGKATGADFLDHVQRTVDKIVLEKDAKIHHLEAQTESLTEQVRIKTEWVRDRDDYIVTLQEAIANLQEVIRQKDGHIEWLTTKNEAITAENKAITAENEAITAENEAIKKTLDEILSSRFWKITKPGRVLIKTVRKILPKKDNVR